jgi:hypothetical protein
MEPAKWQIPSVDPEITTVNSKDHILFFADNDTTQGPLHLNFKLSSAGEFIGLSAKIGDSFLWLDSIHFGPQIANESYGRFPDGSVDWMALYPQTPLQSNLITHTLPVVETSLTLSVFPNPTSDWLNVSMNCTGTPGVNPLVLSLRDLTGRWVEERSLQIWQGQNSFRMDLMELPAGIYILTVESESGLISKKIIKTD